MQTKLYLLFIKNNLKYLVALLLILLFAYLVTMPKAKAKGVSGSNKILSVYDKGKTTQILTDKKTIEEALKDAGFVLSEADIVEPAKNTEIVATSYSVNIYRAHLASMQDGFSRKRIMTASSDGKEIAKQMGIKLRPEDRVDTKKDNSLEMAKTGISYVVRRARPVKISLYGSETTIYSLAETLEDLLKEKNITLKDEDRANFQPKDKLNGDLIRIWRIGVNTQTVEEDINFTTETIRDANHDMNYRNVKQEGKNGRKKVTYESVINEKGEVTDRKVINSIEITPMTPKIEVVGTSMRYTGGGSKSEWLSQSGIDPGDWGYAEFLIGKESHWNPNAYNASSGACGLAQALPCSKVPGNGFNPVDSLRWANGYVKGRYGGWAGAVAHSKSTGWY